MSIDESYFSELKAHSPQYIEEYKEVIDQVNGSTAIYNGVPIDTLFMPKFFSTEQIKSFEVLINTMVQIMDKVMKEYLKNEEYRKLFPFTKKIEELILVDHGFHSVLPIARIDFFYNEENGEFKFCEFNTDGASAMNEDRELTNIFSETVIFKKMMQSFEIKPFELMDSWIDELLAIYQTTKNPKKNPLIAMIDFLDKATLEEFVVFKEFFEKRGFTTIIADIREVEFDGEILCHKGQKIDLVYRRAVTTEITSHYSEIEDFIRACKSGKVCIVGPIKTQIVHNKLIFKILQMEETYKFLEKEEIQFIKNHIPKTYLLQSCDIEVEQIIEEKNQWIIKPIDLYGSKGVYAGLDFDKESWGEKVRQCIDHDYLIQEYYPPFMTEFPVIDESGMKFEMFRNITGVYIYNGKMKGILSRAGQKAVISGINNGVTLPTFVYEEVKK